MGGGQQPICIDCGTHAGLVSDILLQCGGKVYAFEPNRILFAMLEKKYANNPNIILHPYALSNKNGKTTFLSYSSISQGNRIVDNANANDCNEAYEVEVIGLVEYIHNNILNKYERIYFLKLDIEGAEFEIMDKILATELYKKIDFIACETHERYFDDGEEKITRLKAQIQNAGAKNILLDWV